MPKKKKAQKDTKDKKESKVIDKLNRDKSS